MAKKPSRSGTAAQPTSGSPPASPPELVVVTRAETAMRASAGRFEALSGEDTRTLATVLADHGAVMRPLFGRRARPSSNR